MGLQKWKGAKGFAHVSNALGVDPMAGSIADAEISSIFESMCKGGTQRREWASSWIWIGWQLISKEPAGMGVPKSSPTNCPVRSGLKVTLLFPAPTRTQTPRHGRGYLTPGTEDAWCGSFVTLEAGGSSGGWEGRQARHRTPA